MQYGFQRTQSGLYAPSPGGLPGFQRQGMDQRKKNASVAGFLGYALTTAPGAATTLINWPTGARVGDLAVLHAESSAVGGLNPSTSGWTAAGGYAGATVGGNLQWKILDATDLTTATITHGAGSMECNVWVFRGCTALTERGAAGNGANDGTATKNVAGFTKGASAKALLFACTANVAVARAVSAPVMSHLTSIQAGDVPVGLGYQTASWVLAAANLGEYVDGTTITFNFNDTATWNQRHAGVFEIT